jgi:hypothetical protein
MFFLYPRNVNIDIISVNPSSFKLELLPPKIIFISQIFLKADSYNFAHVDIKNINIEIFFNHTLKNEIHYLGFVNEKNNFIIYAQKITEFSLLLNLENSFETNFIILKILEEFSVKKNIIFLFKGKMDLDYGSLFKSIKIEVLFEKNLNASFI